MFKWDSLTKLLSRAHTWTGVQTLTSPVLTSPALNTGVSGTAVDTDNTLAANSDTLLASQKAVKAHVAAAIAAIPDPLLYKGVIDCSTSPNYPAADAGHVYVVSVAGLIGGGSGTAVAAGDTLLCRVDSSAAGTQAAVGANWNILEKNIDLSNVTIAGGTITGITDLVVADGGTGASTLTDHGVLAGSGTDAITALAVGTNGQVLVGSTGADPVFATITDGEGIDTTLGAGTLGIACEDTSETNKGVVELATDAETIAGSDTARAVTAANLKAKLGTQTDGGLLVGAGQTAAVEALAAGALTELLVGGGAGVNPVWTTATGTGAPVRADSPTLTGTPLAPTAAVNTNTTQVATTAYVIAQSQNHAKAQVLDAFYRIITPANARLVLLFDQAGAVSTITDRSTIGGTTAHVVTLRDVDGNAINASTMSPDIVGLAPILDFNASNNWDTPDAADLSFGDGANDVPFSIITLIKMNSVAAWSNLVAKDDVPGNNEEYFLDVATSGYVYMVCMDQSVAGPARIGRRTDVSAVGTTAYTTIIGTKSAGITSADIKIYINGVQSDTADYNFGAYVAMENLSALVASYSTGAGPAKESIGNFKAAFTAIVAEELTALQVRQLDTVLRGWAGNSFN